MKWLKSKRRVEMVDDPYMRDYEVSNASSSSYHSDFDCYHIIIGRRHD